MERRRLPSLKALQAFEAFARSGAMTRAAALLGVTHGAVSRQIKALEQELGAPLVAGPRHALVLTAAGRELAAALTGAFDRIAAALPGAAGDETLAVSCLGTFALKWLIPRLPAFLAAHPGAQVRLVEDQGPADFANGAVQGAIRLCQGPAPAGLKATAFLAQAYGPVCAPALLAAAGGDPERLLRAPRLHSETFAAGGPGTGLRAQFLHAGGRGRGAGPGGHRLGLRGGGHRRRPAGGALGLHPPAVALHLPAAGPGGQPPGRGLRGLAARRGPPRSGSAGCGRPDGATGQASPC